MCLKVLAFGIPTTFMHEEGNVHERLINKSLAYLATTHGEILDLINTYNRSNIDLEL